MYPALPISQQQQLNRPAAWAHLSFKLVPPCAVRLVPEDCQRPDGVGQVLGPVCSSKVQITIHVLSLHELLNCVNVGGPIVEGMLP